MRIFSKTALTAVATALISMTASAAHADVLLTFDVSNVTQNDCTGAMQPTCANTAVGDFVESMRISSFPLTAPTDTSLGSVMQTSATYDFPYWLSGTPYTSALASRVTNSVTSTQTYTQLDSTFDTGANTGNADAQILSDQISDITDDSGYRTQQEYKLSYNLLTSFTDNSFYTDLVHESLYDFFHKYLNTISGTFDELGTTSTLDPVGLGIAPYAFTEYRGNIKLEGVTDVPEPGTWLLSLASIIGMAGAMRLRKSGSALG